MSRFIFRFFFLFLSVGVFFAVGGCGKSDDKPAGAPTQQGGGAPSAKPGGFGVPLVRVKKAVKEDFPEVIKVVGSLEANEEVLVSAEVSAKITKIEKDEGKFVKKGETLLVLDEEKFVLEVKKKDGEHRKAVADAEYAKKDYLRKKELLKEGIVSEKAFEEAKNKWDAARGNSDTAHAALALVKQDLANSRIKAPFSGTIVERYASVGTYVKPGDKLLKLISLDPIKVTATIPERYAKSIKPGHEITLSVSTLNSDFKGHVYFVSPDIDVATRTFVVKSYVENGKGTLNPGLFANVSIVMGVRKGVFLLPESAVINKADRSVVFVLSGDTAVEKSINVEARVEGIIMVSEGIEEGSDVIVEGAYKLANGSKVSLAPAAGATAPAAGSGGKATEAPSAAK